MERRFALKVTVAGQDVSQDLEGQTFTVRELEGLLIVKIPASVTTVERCQAIMRPWLAMAETTGRFVLFCGETEFLEVCALEIPSEMKGETVSHGG